jgi:uncharacterized protein (TIGR00369 family)
MTELEKNEWTQRVQQTVHHYLNLNDGGFDGGMKASFSRCDPQSGRITLRFETQKWQINERGGIHGGAIAGMFDTAFGIVANFLAGKNEATTVDMIINFLRPLELGEHCEITVVTVKSGRSLIRLRAEMAGCESGKLIATGSGSWMPL